ncbi:MAG: DUF692 family protein [Myxococcaceae bacterium]
MSVRFPAVARRGLGAGLDLPWDGVTGFGPTAHGDGLAPPLATFLSRHPGQWAHAFFSWQPRDRSPPRLEDYAPAWDQLVAALPANRPFALHHTALNLASLAPYERGGLLAFTRALCERYALQWVNEDVGFWSLDGRAVPYPLPPLLTGGGLAATIRNTRECQDGLSVPLVLEFPGFSAGASVVVGEMHAYDFFRRLAEATDAPVTLDVGHLLSWQWWRGRRGRALFDELERLPLEHCFELHLSGCEVVGETFVDAHHGTLLDEQFELTERLLERCPNLRVVTWEDPRFDATGTLGAPNRRSWERLQQVVAKWLEQPIDARDVASAGRRERHTHGGFPLAHVERALGDYLHGATPALEIDGLPVQEETAAVEAVHSMVRERRYRGTGGLREWFPQTLAAFPDLSELVARFCASAHGSSWREHGGGPSLEEALYRFLTAENVGEAGVREDEFLGAVVRALAVAPRASFSLPAEVRRTAAGFVAVTSGMVLHAAVGGRYVRGRVTPMLAALLTGEPLAAGPEVELVRRELVSRELVA